MMMTMTIVTMLITRMMKKNKKRRKWMMMMTLRLKGRKMMTILISLVKEIYNSGKPDSSGADNQGRYLLLQSST